ncbi:MAG TPA: hypothetical protein VIK52_09990 [Opitutaceae bacterium]
MSTESREPGEIVIQPLSSAYDPGDARWETQVQGLLDSLKSNVGEVRKEVTPVAGQKGGIVEIIIALGSAGAITAAVQVFKHWLDRDTTREIKITTKVVGGKKTTRISGKNISKELLSEALGHASK